VNHLWLQIASKNTLSASNGQGKTFNTNIAKVQAKKGLAIWHGNGFV
jgi:hypothetical protein